MDARRICRFVLAHRRAVVALVLASIGCALLSARHIRVRFSFRDFYDYPGNPSVPLLERYEREFGDPAGSVDVLVASSDVFQPEVLSYLQTLTQGLEQEALFSRVTSLTNAQAIFPEAGGARTGPLLPRLPASSGEIARARGIARQSPLLLRHLISERASLTLVRAQLTKLQPSVDEQREAVEAARRVLAARPPPRKAAARIVGAPVIAVSMTEPLLRDQRTLTSLAIVVIVILLALTFGSTSGVLVPLLTLLTALVWTAGVFPLMGRPMDLVSSVIPATLLVYGAVDPIFIMTRVVQRIEEGASREEAIVGSYGELMPACLLASITTALGFCSFAWLKLPLLRTFGLTAGIGVCFAFVTTLILLPILLVWLPIDRRRSRALAPRRSIDRGLVGLWSVLKTRRRLVVLAAVGVALVSALIGMRQQISIAYSDLLPPVEGRALLRYVEQHLDGVGRTAVLIEGAPGAIERPDVLRAIDKVSREAKRHSIVTSATSFTDLLTEAHLAFTAPDFGALGPDVRRGYVNDEYSHAQIAIRFTDGGSAAWRALRGDLEAVSTRAFAGLPVTVSLTGFSTALYPVLDRAVIELLWGFVLSFGVVVALQLLFFRSIRFALISILPNALPVLACFALLAAAGVTLRIGSVLFLSVSLGGLFNTTIQLSARVRRCIADGAADPDQVIERSLRIVGPPALFTATILSLGLAVFTLSRFPDLRLFGLLSLTTLAVGFVSDVVVTPVLLRSCLRWNRKDRYGQ